MSNNFGGGDKETIKLLETVLSQTNQLLERQEQLVRNLLEAEKKIGEARIGFLRDANREYESIINKAVTMKGSNMPEWLINGERLLEKFVSASEGMAAAAETITESAAETAASAERVEQAANKHKASRGGNLTGNGGSGVADTNKQYNTNEIKGKLDKQNSDELNIADSLIEAIREGNYWKFNSEEQKNMADGNKEYKKLLNQRGKLMNDEFEQAQDKLAKRILLDNQELQFQKEMNGNSRLVTQQRMEAEREMLGAQIEAQKLQNDLTAQTSYWVGTGEGDSTAAGKIRKATAEARDETAANKRVQEDISKYITQLESQAYAKNGGKSLTDEQHSEILRKAAEKQTTLLAGIKESTEKSRKEQADKAVVAQFNDDLNKLRNGSLKDKKEAWNKIREDHTGGQLAGAAAVKIFERLADAAKQLDAKVENIASLKGYVDTRMQGSGHEKSWATGSYWDSILHNITSISAFTPYFKQEDFTNNIKSLVDQGIAFDLEQRAFLMTIQEKIATTFNAADGTLLRLIRIQQEDTTAGRLGMESALNTYLNHMYENSEYLRQVSDSVRSSLEEMQSLMSGAEAAEVEFQVQKWLGSLYSVGMSQSAVQSISGSLGQIASGQIEGITSGGTGNLLVMAANDAGLSIADILTNGVDAKETNKLLDAAVGYLADLADSSKDNKVVQQELAKVFGVSASDLRAAANLVPSSSAIKNKDLSYEGMLGQLMAMAGSMGDRTSLGEMGTNLWENVMYSIAGSVATNPLAYGINKMATLLDNTVGGIALPFVNVMGFGVDLNTSVSDLMRVGAMGGSILGSLVTLVDGLASSFSSNAMLEELGIVSNSGLAVTPRGDGSIELGNKSNYSTMSVSKSGYIGNASGSDVKNSTLAEAEASKEQAMIEAQEESTGNTVDVINNTVLKIYELLDDVAHGSGSLRVKVEGYGLTKTSGSLNNASSQGGVAGISNSNYSTSNTSLSVGGRLGTSDFSGNASLGGWTTT